MTNWSNQFSKNIDTLCLLTLKPKFLSNMCKDKTKKEGIKSQLCIWITLAIIGVIAAWGLSWWLINKNIDCTTERGTFGDMFGAVNALFSGLAFAGLIATLLYQRDELKLQRTELSLTHQELKAQKLEFQEQNKTMKRQRFENTFFNMLSLQQEIIANLSYEYYPHLQSCPNHILEERFYKDIPKVQLHGREVFEGMYHRAIIDYDGKRYADGVHNILKCFGYQAYTNINTTTRFDHYFRHLYRIFKYVDSTELIEDNERYDYACIVRSQLSDYELVILFYSGLTAGRDKFKPLIEKYSVLNNLRFELLAKANDKEEYAQGAYNRFTK